MSIGWLSRLIPVVLAQSSKVSMLRCGSGVVAGIDVGILRCGILGDGAKIGRVTSATPVIECRGMHVTASG